MPRPFGTDHLDVAPEGRLAIHATAAKGWHGAVAPTQTSPAHPGTAVHWEDELWEVVSAQDLPGGGARYELSRWNERHATRHVVRYDEASERLLAEGRKRDGRRARGWVRVLLLSPLYGLLPASAQHRIEDETAFPATVMTLASAIPLFVFGVFSLISLLAGAVGGGSLFPTGLAVAGVYFLAESSARLTVAMAQGRAIGSLIGETLVTLSEAIRKKEGD